MRRTATQTRPNRRTATLPARPLVFRPPLLPAYGSVFMVAWMVYVAAYVVILSGVEGSPLALLKAAAVAGAPLVARLFLFRLEVDEDGMRWRGSRVNGFQAASLRVVARWSEIERVELDPYTEATTVIWKDDRESLPLPVYKLSIADAWKTLEIIRGHGLLAERPLRTTSATGPALPWDRRGIHPGMLVLYILMLCAALINTLLGLAADNVKAILYGSTVPLLVLPRFWFRALRVDERGIHTRRYPLPFWRHHAWTEIAAIHGGSAARTLRLRTWSGTWHKTGIAIDESDFNALRAELRAHEDGSAPA
ncbi:MAG: hypothetical protein R3E85_09905 [Planctomycetota bacterium]